MAKRPPSDGARPAGSPVRCATYTRKSTEEGLEQEFNSLDAQREACAAYIASQRHEGWTPVKDSYDDGGFSGGNMERPGLKRLLADIAAGKVQVIVLYKIDRLTRSLSDFSRIVDVLDKAGASFVSVTQSFNTTSSMGRLMLNVLLSFAQFEREVTGERIRDKIAASKKKGMWMGGPAPLGYEVRDRKLVVNETEAEVVRHIFQRYVALGSGQALLDELREQGYRTKRRPQADGSVKGGIPFERGMLFHLLGNRVYVGETVHKGTAHPGEHRAIIDPELWEAVQRRIAANSVERKTGRNSRESSLLAGVIVDGHGRRMSPSHAVKSGRRYRYYITHASAITDDRPAWRMPARDLEAAVVSRLTGMFKDRLILCELVHADDAVMLANAFSRASAAADRLDSSTYHRRTIVASIVRQVRLCEDEIVITLDNATLANMFGAPIDDARPLVFTAPIVRVRRGREVKLVLTDGIATDRDEQLIALLAEARVARERVLAAPELTIKDIASASGQCRKRLGRLFGIAYLAPDIVAAILQGRQPPALSTRTLLTAKLPLAWDRQKTMLGFA